MKILQLAVALYESWDELDDTLYEAGRKQGTVFKKILDAGKEAGQDQKEVFLMFAEMLDFLQSKMNGDRIIGKLPQKQMNIIQNAYDRLKEDTP